MFGRTLNNVIWHHIQPRRRALEQLQFNSPHGFLLTSTSSYAPFSFQSNRIEKRVNFQQYATSKSDSTAEVRLSKRMSELGICSRREAAKILKETTNATDMSVFDRAIYLRGEPVTAGTGVKVANSEQYIEIRSAEDMDSNETRTTFLPYDKLPWEKIRGDTVILNKPIGYVSGQEEHQHVPAVRLLTPSNLSIDEDNLETKEAMLNDYGFRFTWKKLDGFDVNASSVSKNIKNSIKIDKTNEDKSENPKKQSFDEEGTLSGYAPAGRLDIDSTGLIIFTRAGMMARKIISPDSKIPKEYIVKVQPAVQPTAREIKAGLDKLPPPNKNLRPLLRGGVFLHDDAKPLKPLLEAEWLDENTLKLVLREGKKRQIRRMCRGKCSVEDYLLRSSNPANT